MKKILLALAVGNAVMLGIGAAAQASAPTPAVTFNYISVDSPGKDTGTNASINGEYFRLRNNTGKAIKLEGWTVRDKANHVYRFGFYFLPAQKTITVHTGQGSNGTPDGHRYWGSGNYIWNNKGDAATLKNTAGTTIDACVWDKVAGTNC